ncbi:MAG: thioredoxin [Anaerolineaceae bacterium 4572_5.1]|nr:MAG: thioredoxin [Anaerolineaceae bacterium 4572_5.1]
MSEVNYVTKDKFKEDVLEAGTPILIDFTADWCGPCKMMAPVLAELAKEWEGKIKILKLDVDENKEIAARYGVMSIPTLIPIQAWLILSSCAAKQSVQT